MKKTLLLLVVAGFGMTMFSCEKPKDGVVSVEKVSLNETSVTLTAGETVKLSATVLPENAADKGVVWESSDKTVATVNTDGEVKAVAAGTATVTVTTNDGAKTAKCVVTVNAASDPVVPVTKVELDRPTLTLLIDATETLKATVSPDTATDKTVAWKSSAEAVATVSDMGVVTAVGAGETTITVTATDGGHEATCIVTVVTERIPVTKVELDKVILEIAIGNVETLKATVSPDGATDKSVTWKSSAEAVATVSDKGVVTAMGAGEATITVKTTDGGFEAACRVTVAEPTQIMTMTASQTKKARVEVGGIGDVVIDWGDGTDPEKVKLMPPMETRVLKHSYSTEDVYIITVEGNVMKMDCNGNKLTSLDVTRNAALDMLHCYENQLESLDLSKNGALTELRCFNNKLTSLDATNNAHLAMLWCYGNKLASLDVTRNGKIYDLRCQNNKLESLDVTNLSKLESMNCSNNQITSLDLTKNPKLGSGLFCYNNKLTSLDVSHNPLLTRLTCSQNQLTSLDMSNNPALTHLSLQQNQLDAAGLNAMFGTLHNNDTSWKRIAIAENPGTADCDQTIASDKGWTVNTTDL